MLIEDCELLDSDFFYYLLLGARASPRDQGCQRWSRADPERAGEDRVEPQHGPCQGDQLTAWSGMLSIVCYAESLGYDSFKCLLHDGRKVVGSVSATDGSSTLLWLVSAVNVSVRNNTISKWP